MAKNKARRKASPIDELRLKYDKVLRVATVEDSPLVCVVISAALTEKALVTFLSNFFVNGSGTSEHILSEKGGLGEFSRCADAAYCLGLISDGMLKNLRRIAEIQNLFAHADVFIDFDHPDVKEVCAELTTMKGWFLPREGGKGVPPKTAEVRHQHTLIPAFLGFVVLVAERIVRTGEPPVFAGTVFLVVLFLICLLHDWASGMRRYRSYPLDVAIMTMGLVATIVVGYFLALDDVFLRLITLGELLVGIGIIHWLRDR